MARGINKVTLLGHLGTDPVVRTTQSGVSMGNFTLATGESWKNKNTGENEQRTEWHKIVVANKLADVCRDYLKKGSRIYLEGKLRTRKWQDKQGNDVHTTEIICHEILMLDTKGSGENAAPTHATQDDYMPSTSHQSGNIDDSDIPF